MSLYVSEKMKNKAKTVNFKEFMMVMYPDECRADGADYAKSTQIRGVVFMKDGYFDNIQQQKDDGIRFLQLYHHLSFQQAVIELCAYADGRLEDDRVFKRDEALRVGLIESKSTKSFHAPQRSNLEKSERDMQNYLEFRGINFEDDMKDVIYPTVHGKCTNIVFLSRDCKYGELNSSIPGARFKQKIAGSESDGYWIIGSAEPKKVYICESAIDALSLRQIQHEKESAYASIGGCGCRKAVERIRSTYTDALVIIAFDHDEAGQNAANKYLDSRIIPVCKDWNEDLCRRHLIVRTPGDGLERKGYRWGVELNPKDIPTL